METLNREQRAAYEAIMNGDTILLTGPGGSGKSHLLSVVFDDYTPKTGRKMAITAMTGCAALLLGPRMKAKTLHSWAAVGLAKDPVNVLIKNIRKSSWALKRWLGTDCLVIDEVSMMTPEFLEMLNEIGKRIRKSEEPFGGIQVIFVGDFYQLPPVNKTQDEKNLKFAFESPLWPEIVKKVCVLKMNMRQSDPVFQELLIEARAGCLSETSIELLKGRMGLPWKEQLIRPTLLFSRKAEVDYVNDTNLKKLKGPFYSYKAQTVFLPIAATKGYTNRDPHVLAVIDKMDRDSTYCVELKLAVGAQVMLLWNRDADGGLVNGSRGVVVGFEKVNPEDLTDEEKGVGLEWPQVKFMNGKTETIEPHSWDCESLDGVRRMQIPLALAYAVTIHKSQGATLDSALIDIGPTTFECGQAYVALSRVRALDSLYIWELDPSAFKVHPRVREFYRTLEN